MGAPVSMVGMIGDDAYGQALRQGLIDDGIDVGGLRTASAVHSGVALILVDDAGQNRIVLAPGANARLGAAEVNAEAARIAAAAMLIVQLEVPLEAVQAAIAIAHRAGVTVLLNPAPAVPLPAALWPMIDLLVLNEGEAGALSGVPVSDPQSAWAAARTLRALGAGRVLVTLGAQGVASVDQDGERHAAARPVRAVDTTAAGDTFIGALATALRSGLPLPRALELAQAASALCVTRPGAQPSIPYRHEIDDSAGTPRKP
jgi:ribokinase